MRFQSLLILTVTLPASRAACATCFGVLDESIARSPIEFPNAA
jgi:hypothetical protein